MQRDKRKVESSLEKKGFIKEPKDHNYFHYQSIDGKMTAIFTKTSHAPHKEIGDILLNQMAKQCKISKQDFLDLIDCPLSREQYETYLIEHDFIPA